MSHPEDDIAAALGELRMFRALVPVYGPTREKFEAQALMKAKRQRLRARGLEEGHAGSGLFEALLQPPARESSVTEFKDTDWFATVTPTYGRIRLQTAPRGSAKRKQRGVMDSGTARQ